MASPLALHKSIQMHIEPTQMQTEGAKQAIENLDPHGRQMCEAMCGFVEEATHGIGNKMAKI